jgi:hypothetical protein
MTIEHRRYSLQESDQICDQIIDNKYTYSVSHLIVNTMWNQFGLMLKNNVKHAVRKIDNKGQNNE